MPKDPDNQKGRVPERLRQWFQSAKGRGVDLLRKARPRINDGSPRWRAFDFDLRKFQIGDITRASTYIRWGLIVLVLFFLAEFAARSIGIWLQPGYVPPLPRQAAKPKTQAPQPQYETILSRNMFNVEGTIPEPFDQAQLDCFSQAKLSSRRTILMGTIVMNDDKFSVALIQQEGSNLKEAVKLGDSFGEGRLQVLKVERKRLCFQVKSSQDLEYIEIPDADPLVGANASLSSPSSSEGITALSEDKYQVNQSFLAKNILNLNEILQTARAVPYLDPATGQFKGFLLQSMEPDSPFSKLGVRQGDILTSVNDIVLDNAGKGLEAFQRLQSSPKIELEVIRAGQRKGLSYDIRP